MMNEVYVRYIFFIDNAVMVVNLGVQDLLVGTNLLNFGMEVSAMETVLAPHH